MDIAVLCIFCAILIVCVITKFSLVLALLAGLVLFLAYGLLRGFGGKALLSMCLSGAKTVSNVLLTLLLIGVLTALWRASGCIPTIVCYAAGLIHPSVFVLLTFLLNCLVSVLTGTAFGTAATMGVICMSIANSMGLPPFWVGGAILSGVFFGDRCSPVSTSALLVCTLTETDIYTNIKAMIRSAAVPFAAACAVYLAAGFFLPAAAAQTDVSALFHSAFRIHPLCLLPAVCILVPAALRLNVKLTMVISIAASFFIALFLQGVPLSELLRTMLTGYQTDAEALSAMINGGGVLSMVRVAAIILIAACYSGIFEKTGLLDFLRRFVVRLAEKCGNFRAVALISLLTSAISCNQTLAIMLTDQLSADLKDERGVRALRLEDTAVVLAPLIPWSIAGSVPLTSVGAPMRCILGACFLYLLPLWHALRREKA